MSIAGVHYDEYKSHLESHIHIYIFVIRILTYLDMWHQSSSESFLFHLEHNMEPKMLWSRNFLLLRFHDTCCCCCWSSLPPLYSFGAFRESVIQRIWCKCVQLYCGIRLNVQTTSVVWFTQLWSFRTKLDWQYYKECPKEPRPDC